MPAAPLAVGSFPPILAIALPQGYEWLMIGAIALLFFGKKLPTAARGIGQGILEFKKGMKDGGPSADAADQPAPRFDPHTGKPLA